MDQIFISQLHRACEMTRQKLGRAQTKMKYWYDHKTKDHHSKIGDKVLVLVPYAMDKYYDHDYVIATPNRSQQKHVCHAKS